MPKRLDLVVIGMFLTGLDGLGRQPIILFTELGGIKNLSLSIMKSQMLTHQTCLTVSFLVHLAYITSLIHINTVFSSHQLRRTEPGNF